MCEEENNLPYLPTQHTNIKYKLKIPTEYIDFLLENHSEESNWDIHVSVVLHYLKYYPVNKLLYIYTYHKELFFTPKPNDFSLLNHYIDIILNIKRQYFILHRVVTRVKRQKYYESFNDFSLTFEDIDETKPLYKLYKNRRIYIFPLRDIKMICTNMCFFHSDFTIAVKQLRNPYTNTILSKSVLYGFYCFLKEHNSVPELYYLYMNCNFNEFTFKLHHRYTILKFGIHDYYKNASNNLKMNYFYRMVYRYYPDKGFDFDDLSDECIDEFYTCFEYLIIPFMHVMYCDETRIRQKYDQLLRNKFILFYSKNHMFGRRVIRRSLNGWNVTAHQSVCETINY